MTTVEGKKAEAIVSEDESSSSGDISKCRKRSASQDSKNQLGAPPTNYQKITSDDSLRNSHKYNFNIVEHRLLQFPCCGTEQLDSSSVTLSKKPTKPTTDYVETEPTKIESEGHIIIKACNNMKECNNVPLSPVSSRSIASHRNAPIAVNSAVAFIAQPQIETMGKTDCRDHNENYGQTVDPHSNPQHNDVDLSSPTSNQAQQQRPTIRKNIGNAPLPDPDTCPQDMHPDQFLKMITLSRLGYNLEAKSAPSLSIFSEISEDELSSYAIDVVTATRDNDLENLRQIHESGRSLSCCNRFGESILHMACRRGYTEIVRYMIHEAHVSVRIKDDCGRTPFHDACWNQNTNIEILDMLMKEDPLLFLVSDNRGSTAFEYARHEHWPVWRKFLHDRSSYFDTVEDSTAKYFMAKP